MRILGVLLIGALAAAALPAVAIAQHQHSHEMAAPHGSDRRELVQFPPALAEATLANMRDHLQSLQEIQLHLGMGDSDLAAKIAESRLGMSSLSLHGAAEVSKYMPQGMQDAGSAMHHAASKFAIIAQDASAIGDMKPVFTALADLTAQCVGCHAAYRFK
jgi:hypothetical protein